MAVPTKKQVMRNFKKRKWWAELGRNNKEQTEKLKENQKSETEEERKEKIKNILSLFKKPQNKDNE